VFDFDGTLVDTAPVICHAFSEAVRGTAAERPPEGFLFQLGQPLTHVFAHLQGTVAGFDQQVAEFLERYRDAHDAVAATGYVLFDGVREALEGFGFNLAIASTKPTTILERHAALLGIDVFFDVIQGTDDFPFKPDPEILHRVWTVVPGRPERTAFVGDSVSDIQAGRAAGVTPLGVTFGAHSRAALEQAGAVGVFDTFSELQAFLNG
jgi:phosphoglycolate phosphatase